MKLQTTGNYGLHTLQYPSGRWGYVGNVPVELCDSTKNYASLVFETEQDAIDYFNALATGKDLSA